MLVTTNIVAIEKRGELIAKEGYRRVTGNTQKFTDKLVAVSAAGRPVGEDHPKAVLANAELDLVFSLREEGFSMQWLADKFEVTKGCIQGILSGRRRAVIPAGYRRMKVKDKAR